MGLQVQQAGPKVLQIARFTTGTYNANTAQTPLDNTIPQITEGTEFMNLAITPLRTTSTLKIDIVFNGCLDTSANWMILHLHRDSTANAIGAVPVYCPTGTGIMNISFSVTTSSTATTSTTFRLRVGANVGASQTQFNGSAGNSYMGGTMASSITITEYEN